MVRAMQEIYPSTNTVLQQVTALRAQLSKINVPEMTNMSAQLEQTTRGHQALVEQTQKDRTFHITELAHLKTQFNAFSQHLATLWQKVDSEFPHTTKDIQSLGDHINRLAQQFNDHVAWINGDIQSKEAARQEVLQDMSKERDRVIGQITSLTEQMNEIKTETTDSVKAMDEKIRSVCSANIEPLLDRISETEGSATDRVEALQKRIEDLNTSIQGDIATSTLRLECLETAQESLRLKNSESHSVTAESRIPARLVTSAPSSGLNKTEIGRKSEPSSYDSAGTNARTRSQSREQFRNHASSRSAQKRKRIDMLFEEETNQSAASGLSDSRSLTSTPSREDASSKSNHITGNSADHNSPKKKKRMRPTPGTLEAQPIVLDSQ